MRRYLVLARFPDRVREAVATGVVGRGISEGHLAIEGRCLTDFGLGKHRKIDDKPFGGGAGLVLEPTSSCQRFDGRRRSCPARRW